MFNRRVCPDGTAHHPRRILVPCAPTGCNAGGRFGEVVDGEARLFLHGIVVYKINDETTEIEFIAIAY